MKPADATKIQSALNITTNIEGQLKNFINRAPGAGKHWSSWATADGRAAADAAQMKKALQYLSQMLKDVKTVVKDIDKAESAADQKALANYDTAKEYRDKVLAKQHTSLRAWHSNAVHFRDEMGKVVPGVQFIKVSPNPAVEESATYKAVENFLTYYDAMTKALAKLG